MSFWRRPHNPLMLAIQLLVGLFAGAVIIALPLLFRAEGALGISKLFDPANMVSTVIGAILGAGIAGWITLRVSDFEAWRIQRAGALRAQIAARSIHTNFNDFAQILAAGKQAVANARLPPEDAWQPIGALGAPYSEVTIAPDDLAFLATKKYASLFDDFLQLSLDYHTFRGFIATYNRLRTDIEKHLPGVPIGGGNFLSFLDFQAVTSLQLPRTKLASVLLGIDRDMPGWLARSRRCTEEIGKAAKDVLDDETFPPVIFPRTQ